MAQIDAPTSAPGRHAGTDERQQRGWLWVAGVAAAVVLVTGLSGALASWTAAFLTNDQNTAGARDSYLALVETDGSATCDTSTAPDNTLTSCSTINKFGGSLTMSPGDSSTVDVTFTNPGTADGGRFEYTPGTCTPTNGPGGVDLCVDGDLTVSVACSPGTTYSSGSALAALGQSATPGALTSRSWTASPALAASSGSAVTCRFVTTLASSAAPNVAGSAVSQSITWTLAVS